jgi:hypothetical protein
MKTGFMYEDEDQLLVDEIIFSHQDPQRVAAGWPIRSHSDRFLVGQEGGPWGVSPPAH